jgi:hypothetical protein
MLLFIIQDLFTLILALRFVQIRRLRTRRIKKDDLGIKVEEPDAVKYGFRNYHQ